MGGGHSLPLSVSDSIVNPGNPSIVSDPIELDYDVFLDELVALLKYPVDGRTESVLKDCIVTEGATPEEFEVKVVLDPAKLRSFGRGNPSDPSLERIKQYNKVTFSRQGRYLLAESHEPHWAGEEPKLAFKARADFAKDPLRIDYFWTMPDGSRAADAQTLSALKSVTDQVMAALADRKVVLKFDEAKKAAASGPIDEAVTTYEPLFDALVYCLKNPPRATVEEIAETQFKICPTGEGEQPYRIVSFDKEQGTVKTDLYQADGARKLNTSTFAFSKSPLSLEAWVEQDGERQTGLGTTRSMQNLVDKAVSKATNSSWGLGIF